MIFSRLLSGELLAVELLCPFVGVYHRPGGHLQDIVTFNGHGQGFLTQAGAVAARAGPVVHEFLIRSRM